MTLIVSRKTAKTLTVSHKKVNRINICGDNNGMIITISRKMAKILTVSRKKPSPHWDSYPYVYRLLRRHISALVIRMLATLSSKSKRLKSTVRDSVLGLHKFWRFHVVVWQSTVKKCTKRTCWAIFLPIKCFVLPRLCCCRQVPYIRVIVGKLP